MKIGYFISVALFVCFAAYMYNGCKPAWQFDHLEQNAKKAITARELQSWATNLLARYPVETNFSASELGTNFPHQLRTLAPRLGPHIFVHVYDDTNQPPYVQVYWGSGFLGGTGFFVGATNYVADTGSEHAWQPGVYFYRR